jgi:hypothetical protein
VPELPSRPKPKRLKALRTNRNAVLASLPEEHKPVAEQVLRGGVPAVRQAVNEQNEKLKAEGRTEIRPAGVVSLAEELLPRLRVAEWLDRATGALADLDELDLRDLRSVVVAGDDPTVARDESTRDLAVKLKEGLAARQEREHNEWLDDIKAALEVGRSVRALRLSSRPPKAGVRFPADLATKLTEVTSASLTPEATSDRWVAVLEALAYSPVRSTVTATGIPATVSDELRGTVARLAGLVPGIAKLFGVEPPPPGARAPRPARPTRKPLPPKPRPTGATAATAPSPAAASTESAPSAPTSEAPAPSADAPSSEAPSPESASPETPHTDTETAPAAAAPIEASAPDAPAHTTETDAPAETVAAVAESAPVDEHPVEASAARAPVEVPAVPEPAEAPALEAEPVADERPEPDPA